MLTVPGYDIIEVIFRGHKTTTYRGIRTEDKVVVILKVPHDEYPSMQETHKLEREYGVTHSLDIDSIIKPYALEKFQNHVVLVQEDFSSVPLKELITGKPVGLDFFFRTAIQLSSLLGDLHRQRIIHNDLNPCSIFVNPKTGRIKITNFGYASYTSEESQVPQSIVGLGDSLTYVSPERTGRTNHLVDHRADLYSLGVSFYEMLTGVLPFRTTDSLELIHCHIARQPIPPHEVNRAIPKAISDITMKLMSKAAEDRYLSAFGLRADLEICQSLWQAAGKVENFVPGRNDLSDRFTILPKLYGRDEEITILMNAVERIRQGQTEMMLIAGYSGVGKSSLIDESSKSIVRQGAYFISGKFDQFQRGQPYNAFLYALRNLIRQILTEDEEQIREWKTKLLNAFGSAGQIVIDVIPEVELIVGPQPPVPELGPIEARNRFNFIFRSFIQVFTTLSNLLVIFLDDLQWADGASLSLLQLLMAAPNSDSLFIIGAYRNNEVSETHPLTVTLNEIRQIGGVVNQITLLPLALPYVKQIIADALSCAPQRAAPLAELILAKTDGNPFFVNEFLKSLYAEELLTFDFHGECWQWDVTKIQARNITDNVVELMREKLQKLGQETQHVLKWAACIGNQFDLQTLSVVCEQPVSETMASLETAVAGGLILLLGKGQRGQGVELETLSRYKFAHDQVQQVCYSLIPEAQTQAAHLHVGKLLLQCTTGSKREQKIFDIVNQLNLGKDLIYQQPLLDEVVELNLAAGKKAKSSMAYQTAFKYLEVSLALLREESWERRYGLALDLHVEAAEVAYLNTNFEQMERLSERALQHAKNLMDRARIAEVRIRAYIAQNRALEAVKIAVSVLKQLGVRFPRKPNKLTILQGLIATKFALVGKQIEELADLPRMNDPVRLATMRIFRAINAISYLVVPELFPLIVFRQVKFSTKYGNTADSAAAYAVYGIILCGVVGSIESGYRFGQLALRLSKRFSGGKLNAKTAMSFYVFLMPWKEPLRGTLEPLLSGYRNGLETGDLEFASYLLCFHSIFSYYTGKELTELERELTSHSRLLNELKQERAFHALELYRQIVLNLIDRSGNPCELTGEIFNEQQMLGILPKVNDYNTITHMYLNKLVVCCLFQDYVQAIDCSLKVRKHLDLFRGLYCIAIFYFYESLARLAIFTEASKAEQRLLLKRVASNQRKMHKWAQHAPANYLHKFYIVEAECARVLGRDTEAREYYDKAITLAHENEYVNEEALAHELAGRFYLAIGQPHLARHYMRDAHYAYLRWGAVAKVQDLETRYPQVFLAQVAPSPYQASTGASTASTERHISTAFDVRSVLKASQAIASEIVLDSLLNTLMKIVIENAGAQRGFLILEEEGQLVIKAEGRVDSDKVLVLQSLPVETYKDLPTSIIRYVERTNEQVVLSDATQEAVFVTDPYIIQKQPKSILCVPLVKQGKLNGILYLENSLVTGAFTPQHVEVLNLLAAEAAISIENARLYRSLEEANEKSADYSKTLEFRVERRTEELQKINEELQIANEQVRESNIRKSQFLAGMSHELRTPMNAIIGFTRLVLRRAGDLLPERQRDNLIQVRESADQLLKLINELLDLSKIEAGRMEVRPELFDVRQFITACCEAVSPLVKPGVQLKQEVSREVGEAHTDEEGLRHIVPNLLSNALKFTDVGEVVVRVRLERQATSEASLVITISDSGVGIPADALDTIFEEFQQVEGGIQKHKGTGLGLPIAKKWAELLGGSIAVESEYGKGSTFTVTIPLVYQKQ